MSAKEHETPAWVTEKVWPAIVTVPVRALVEVLAATLTCTVPLPLPDVPEVTVIHEALLVAVHAQAVVPVTVIELPPMSAWRNAEAARRAFSSR